MKSSTKIFAAIAAAGTLGLGALALAAPGQGMAGCDHMGMMGGPMAGKGDPAARMDKHLAHFKSELKITAAQEPLWQAFADRVKAEAGKGMQAMRDVSQDMSLSAPDRMTKHIDIMKDRVAAMESVQAAFKPLYDSMTPGQKRVADIHAARMGHGGPMGHHGHMGPGAGHGGPQGPGAMPVPPAKN
ncbi:MAG TPA: Spy/CpxP family protein refolding chaperone [Rhodocyclaceae bacterium]|nr:Spy/CpxP family protein refolding chaperone [Rhodocyclaceae bacterium]